MREIEMGIGELFEFEKTGRIDPEPKSAPRSSHCYAFSVASVQWAYEDSLPEMDEVDYAHIFERSEVRGGVRMFPYISTYSDSDGTETRHFLGA